MAAASRGGAQLDATKGGKVLRLKVVTYGPSLSGKSCLVKRFCEGKFVSKYVVTIGTDYGVKPIKMDGVTLKLNFWDLSGDDAYEEVRNEFYKDAQAMVLVYDSSRPDSFDSLSTWLEESRHYGAVGLPSVLLANKADKGARVTAEQGAAFAAKHGMDFFSVSAATGDGVAAAFEHVVRAAGAANYPDSISPPA